MHGDQHIGAWNWTVPAVKRSPLLPHVTRRLARWHPPTAAALVVLASLIAHEIGYHLSDGTDFPLELIFNDTHIFVISHGGLDALAVGILAVSVLLLIDAARIRAGRS
jgi:hypothetical protein